MRKLGRRPLVPLVLIVAVLLLVAGCAGPSVEVGGAPAEHKIVVPPAGPPVTPSNALKGVESGEVVYQARDGSIHAVGVDGSDDRRVHSGPPSDWMPLRIVGWSPDRKTVGCVVDSSVSREEMSEQEVDYPLWLVDLSTNRMTEVIADGQPSSLRGGHGDNDAEFTPDGRYMIYLSSWDYILYAADTRTGVATAVAGLDDWRAARAKMLWPDAQSSAAGTVDSHDGRILYQDDDGRLFIKSGQPQTKKRVLPRASETLFPGLSPDGRFVIVQSLAFEDKEVRGRTLSNSIWSVDVSNMKPKIIATGTAPLVW